MAELDKKTSANRGRATPNRGRVNIRLPFENNGRGGGWALWVDRHKVGLLVTVVVYLSLAILFMTYRIVIIPENNSKIELEFTPEQMEELVEQIEQKEMEQVQEYDPSEPMQNKISDANSNYDATLRDSKNSDAGEIYDEVAELQERMRQSQEDYKRELNEIEKIKERKSDDKPKERKAEKGDRNQDAFVKGNVAASFDLEGRTVSYMDIPAYKCEGGGRVVVAIKVNRNGRVIGANVDSSTNTSDRCIINEAVASAKLTRFNASTTAPDPQRGTLTYTFVAQ